MLLVQADTFEAIWCFIFPIVSFSRGTVPSNSAYCQASGFLLAFGIQSSDFAALLIAVHTGLYIFRGHDGLYPFRTLSYGIWFGFAALFASLPFVHSPGYVNRSEICYLPFKPEWVRRAFSWIPRYVIFAAIVLIYTAIYLNVIIVMKNKPRSNSTESGSGSGSGGSKCRRLRSMNVSSGYRSENAKKNSSLPVPAVSEPGLPSATSMPNVENGSRCNPAPWTASEQTNDGRRRGDLEHSSRIALANHDANRLGSGMTDTSQFIFSHGILDSQARTGNMIFSFCRPNLVHPAHELQCNQPPGTSYQGTRRHRRISEPPQTTEGRVTLWQRLASRSKFTIKQAGNSTFAWPSKFRRKTCDSPSDRTAISSLSSPSKSIFRAKARRQVRYMFMYPLGYLALWVLPFVAQLIERDGSIAPPFPLLLLAQVSLCLQGALDAIIFLCWEKPWKYPKNQQYEHCSKSWANIYRMNFRSGFKVGRTREEMQVDMMDARMRRGIELAERQPRSRRREMAVDWWDPVVRTIDEIHDV